MESKTNHLETEIAELSRQIEEKRAALEREQGIIEEEVLVRETLAPHFSSATTQVNPPTATQPVKNYLNDLDQDTIQQVNDLIAAVPEEGFKKVIALVKESHPYLLDVFHDALVTLLYDELKGRGIVK